MNSKERHISIRQAALINLSTKYISVLFTVVLNIILARILSPSDYGEVAVITVFSSFFSIFTDMGFSSGIIQDKTLTDNENSDIFSLTIYIGLLLGAAFFCFSFFISYFYGDEVFVGLGAVLSVSIVLSTINMVPNALIMKRKMFTYAGIRNIVAAVSSLIVTLVLAFKGFKAYSIVLGNVASSSAMLVLNFIQTSLKFRILPGFASIKKILSFSLYQFACTIMNYFSRNLDNLLTGKIMGSEALGYYDKAYKLMLYPINNFTLIISPVLHPILSEHSSDKKYIYNQYMKLVGLFSVLGSFLSILCFFNSKEIIEILYGSKWSSSIPCFQILSLTIGIQMVSSSAGAIYLCLGDTKTMFKSGFVYMITTLCCILIGVYLGRITYLAIGVAISLVIKFFVEYYYLIKKCFGYSYISFLKEFEPDLIIYILTFVLMAVGCRIIPYTSNAVISLTEKVFLTTLFYGLLLVIFGRLNVIIGYFNNPRREKRRDG